MKPKKKTRATLAFRPLTAARWPDVEKLFGERGACGGCWCMYWRETRAQFEQRKGAGNRRAFRELVRGGAQPGVLAYSDGEPVGWCALGPRAQYVKLANSRVLAPVDEQPVWSVVCFFIAREWRNRGLSAKLLRAAADFARRRGAKILEGYPVEARKGRMPDAFAWTGLPGSFLRAGFREVARRSPTRPVMRRTVASG
jgi:GNAT superfamily N-acetyltransferase